MADSVALESLQPNAAFDWVFRLHFFSGLPANKKSMISKLETLLAVTACNLALGS
jgi:hypothetical protein